MNDSEPTRVDSRSLLATSVSEGDRMKPEPHWAVVLTNERLEGTRTEERKITERRHCLTGDRREGSS